MRRANPDGSGAALVGNTQMTSGGENFLLRASLPRAQGTEWYYTTLNRVMRPGHGGKADAPSTAPVAHFILGPSQVVF